MICKNLKAPKIRRFFGVARLDAKDALPYHRKGRVFRAREILNNRTPTG